MKSLFIQINKQFRSYVFQLKLIYIGFLIYTHFTYIYLPDLQNLCRMYFRVCHAEQEQKLIALHMCRLRYILNKVLNNAVLERCCASQYVHPLKAKAFALIPT